MNLRKDGLGSALDKGEIIMVAGDGRQGYSDLAPYDAIHVGAAAPTLPHQLVEQLKSPGRMFIPVGTFTQEILQVDKDENGKITKKELMGVMVRHFQPIQLDTNLWPVCPPHRYREAEEELLRGEGQGLCAPGQKEDLLSNECNVLCSSRVCPQLTICITINYHRSK